MQGGYTMKPIIILTILLLFCFSGLVYAGENGKKVHVKIDYDDKGQITNVKQLGPGNEEKGVAGVPIAKDPVEGVIGVPAQILLLQGDDPCIVQGGIKYCW
jgi:hypothetical protein